MKTIVKIVMIALAAMLLLAIKGASAADEYTKVIKRDFQVNPDASLAIRNKFGKVHINNWEKNEIALEVTITVSASGQESAARRFERISIDINGTAGQVTANTLIEEGKFSGKGKFSVDYLVHMPVSNRLDLSNKFGDIFINEIKGKTKIDLSYGNMEARKLDNSDNLLEISFGKARINWITGAVLTLRYSEMSLDYAGSLRMNSKFSNLDADKIIALNMVQEGGKLDIDKSSSVESKSKFTDIQVGRIDQSLNLDIQYGNCDIDEIPPGFTMVNIRNRYGNVTVNLDDNARYSLDAEMSYCELDFPEKESKMTYRSITHTTRHYKGYVRSADQSASSRVTVNSAYGNVRLK